MLKIHRLNSISVKTSVFFKAGDGYLEFDIRIRLVIDNNFVDGKVIRLVNNAFAYTIQDARISSSAGVEIEQNKYVGPISTIIRLVTQQYGDLSTYFDITDESENSIDNSSLKKIPFINHTDANKGVIRGHLPLKYIFGFEQSFEKITKNYDLN